MDIWWKSILSLWEQHIRGPWVKSALGVFESNQVVSVAGSERERERGNWFCMDFSSVQSLSRVWLFAAPWIAARQPFLSITNSWSLLKLRCVASVVPSHHLLSPSASAFNLSQHQGLSQWVISSIRWPKYWNFSFSISPSNEYSGLISFRMDWLDLRCQRDSPESSPTPQFKSINSLALNFLHSPTLTSIHDHWKNHSFD